MEKILIPLRDNDVAPRFDLATDVLIASVRRDKDTLGNVEKKVVVLDQSSSEAMCRLAISEKIQTVICAGIEDEYHDFLQWKGAKIMDNVCGPADEVLDTYLAGELSSGDCLYKTA